MRNELSLRGVGDKLAPNRPPRRSVVRAWASGGLCAQKAGLPEEKVWLFQEGAWPHQLPDLVPGKHVPEMGVVAIEAKSVVIWSQNWVL